MYLNVEWKILLLFLFGETQHCFGDIISSTSQLGGLYEKEIELLQTVEEYIYKEEERLQNIRRMVQLRRMAKQQETGIETTLDYVGHPLNSFRLIQQLSDISVQMNNNKSLQEFQVHLSEKNLYLPDILDLQGAYKAVARLQNTYNLSIVELMNGSIYGRKAFHKLSLEEVTGLALSPRKWLGMFYTILGRFYLFDFVLESAEPWSPVWIDTVIEKVFAFAQNGNFPKALKLMDPLIANDPDNSSLIHIYENIQNATRREQEFENMIKSDANINMTENQAKISKCTNISGSQPKIVANATNYKEGKMFRFEAHRRAIREHYYYRLCQGEEVPQEYGLKSFICWYRPTFVPYYRVKEEILQEHPRISLMYDVISDIESESLKPLSTEKLTGAKVANNSDHPGRVGKLLWVYDNKSDQLPSILSNRISWLTGLNTVAPYAEPLQVLNYGIGGHYVPHTDPLEGFLQKRNDTNGDRIATFMFYLSQPERGGDTVFPLLNVRVPAVKNAAAFWYNFKKSGEKDDRVLHAGCPVLHGEKWIANKWIRANTQEFRRPCGLTQDIEDEVMP